MISFSLTACNMPARPTSNPGGEKPQVGTIVAMTLSALRTKEPAFIEPLLKKDTPLPGQTSTPTPKETFTPTPTITATYSTPILVFDGNTNCREGPSTNYRVVTVLRAGQKITPVGIQGNYWVVNVPGGTDTCWVATDFATPSGSVAALPTVPTPPPPTSQPPVAPTWHTWKYNCAYATGGSTVTMEMTWTDLSSNESGYKVYRDGQVIATLGPNSSTYTDVFLLATGKTAGYYIEVYNDSGKSDTSTVQVSCQ